MKAYPDAENRPVGHLVPRIVGGVVAVIGGVVLIGWLFSIPVLTYLIPGTATMKANVALGFILAGSALGCSSLSGVWARYAVRACALVTGGLALDALIECVSGWNLGINELLVGAKAGLVHPRCMALNDAVGFMLMAMALWLMSRAPKNACRSWILAVIGGLLLGIGLLATLGYLSEFKIGYSWWNEMEMPLLTALLFFLLGSGALQIAWRREGMHWWIGPRITFGFIGVLVLLVAVAANANRSMKDVMEAAEQVKRTQGVIGTLHELQRYLDEAQSGVRGFLLTGDEDYLPLFDNAIPETHKCLTELHDSMAGNVNQRDRLSVLENLISKRLELLQQLIALRRSAGLEEHVQTQALRRSKGLMGQIRENVKVMASEESLRLVMIESQARAIIGHAYSVLPVGVLLSVLILALGLLRFNRETTERLSGADALREASQKLRLHFDQTLMAIIEWDLDFRVTRWNPAAQAIFGFSAEEALGQQGPFIIPEKSRPHADQIWQVLLNQSGGKRSTNENRCKDGRIIVCEWYNTPLIDEKGVCTGVASFVMDITENRRTLELLAWEKSAMEIIVSRTSLHEVLDGLMRGLERQMPGALGSVLLLDDDRMHLRFGAAPSLPTAYNQAMDRIVIGPAVGSCGTAAYFNRQVIVEDIANDPLWADCRDFALGHGLRACCSMPIHGSEGKILGTFAIYYREPRCPAPGELDLLARAEHLTRIAIERKQAEASLRLKNFVFDESIAANCISDLEGHITEVNDAFLRLGGFAGKEEVAGLSIPHFIATSDKVSEIIASLTQTGQWEGEYIAKRKDGSTFIAHGLATVVRDENGQSIGYQASVLDVTERKRVADFLRLVVNSIPDLVFWKDRNSVYLGCNNAFAQAAGVDSPDHIVGKTDYDLCWKKEESDYFVVVDRQVMANDQARYHIIEPQLRADGKESWLETSKVPLHDEQNQVIGILGTYLDITERKQAEDAILQVNVMLDQRVKERTAELEAVVHELDAFSYSVSHDLRAPLRAVDGFSRILADDYVTRLDENGLRILGVIRSETRRMGQLIDDLLAFSRLGREPLSQAQIDMRALAQAVFDELAEQEPGRKLRFDLHDLPTAYGTQSMIRQVWVNLIGNAIKFTREREVGEIEVGAQDGEDGTPVYYVKDNGAGFDMRYAEKLFGVFQRLHTDQEFAGTGVGLALVHRIVQRHGGRIWADAVVERGAVFYFTLPTHNNGSVTGNPPHKPIIQA